MSLRYQHRGRDNFVAKMYIAGHLVQLGNRQCVPDEVYKNKTQEPGMGLQLTDMCWKRNSVEWKNC